jgi:hypothetical protein
MTGRPPETGGPAPLGSRAGDFRIAAARSMARRDRFFSRGLPGSAPNFLPGDAFGKLPRTVRCPDPSECSNVATAGAKRYVQAKSVVLGVPGQTRPTALDGGR